VTLHTVHDPPTEVIVVGYTWAKGNASSGEQRAFLSLTAAERHLAELVAQGDVEGPITLHRLTAGTWEPVAVSGPQPLRLLRLEATP
jgi:hypothetical protein